MNILVFVSGLILIFAISTHTLLSKKMTHDHLYLSYKGYTNASRKVQNSFEKKLFTKMPGKTEKKKDSNKEKKSSHSSYNRNSPCEKINISPLFTEDNYLTHPLYPITLSLINILYGKKPFFSSIASSKKNFLLEKIIVNGKKALEEKKLSKKAFRLEKIDLHDENLQQIYYYMLKGAPSTNKKMPSLLDHISCSFDSPCRICLLCASLEMVTILFNEQIAQEIIEREKDPNFSLTKELLEKICLQRDFSISPSIQKMIRFSHMRKGKKVSFSKTDKKSQITIKREFHL